MKRPYQGTRIPRVERVSTSLPTARRITGASRAQRVLMAGSRREVSNVPCMQGTNRQGGEDVASALCTTVEDSQSCTPTSAPISAPTCAQSTIARQKVCLNAPSASQCPKQWPCQRLEMWPSQWLLSWPLQFPEYLPSHDTTWATKIRVRVRNSCSVITQPDPLCS